MKSLRITGINELSEEAALALLDRVKARDRLRRDRPQGLDDHTIECKATSYDPYPLTLRAVWKDGDPTSPTLIWRPHSNPADWDLEEEE